MKNIIDLIYNKPSITFLEKTKIPKEAVLNTYVKNYYHFKNSNLLIDNKLSSNTSISYKNQITNKIEFSNNYISQANIVSTNDFVDSPFTDVKVMVSEIVNTNNTFVKVMDNNVSFGSIVGRVSLNTSEINNIPLKLVPDFLIKILNSEHFAIMFLPESLPGSVFAHLFTHREKIDEFFPELKREVITYIDLFDNPRKQMITNPVFEIPSNIISINDLNNTKVIDYVTQNKNKILEILLKEENNVFDIGLYLNEFYNLNKNNISLFDM